MRNSTSGASCLRPRDRTAKSSTTSPFLRPNRSPQIGKDIMAQWIEACAIGDVDEEDVIRFDHAGRTFAIYRSPEDEYFATDGLCTHEKAMLADGLVMDDIIECPKHNGRFN